jgi:hypothetical protein
LAENEPRGSNTGEVAARSQAAIAIAVEGDGIKVMHPAAG